MVAVIEAAAAAMGGWVEEPEMGRAEMVAPQDPEPRSSVACSSKTTFAFI